MYAKCHIETMQQVLSDTVLARAATVILVFHQDFVEINVVRHKT